MDKPHDDESGRSPLRNEIFLGFCFSIGCAVILAIVGNVRESTSTQVSTPEMFRLSNALVTGALGFFAGRASAWAQQRLVSRGASPEAPDPTQTPTSPVTPAQP